MKNRNSVLTPLLWSFLLLAAFFSFMYFADQVNKKHYQQEKLLFNKTQADAESEKKIYGKVTDSTQRKLDSLQKDISAVENNK